MVAKTFYGFEDILEEELKALGAQSIEKGVRNVRFVGDKGFMYKANLCLRTAIRILKPLRTAHVNDESTLYRAIYNIPWEEYIDVEKTFLIQVTMTSNQFNNSMFVAQKAKDAIADRFRQREGKRPSVNKEHPDLLIHLHVQENSTTISLDSSGSSLHQRGYRTATNIAPINEVLAAGMLLLSGWDGLSDFLDPMCGSGTLLVEAAMIACNIPPNLNRKTFAFERWKDWDDDLFTIIEASALNKVRGFDHKIIGYDKAPSAVRKARENIKSADLEDFIEIQQQDFFTSTKDSHDVFLQMVFNPPYDERLAIDVPTFYKEIGDTLKQSYPQSHAWIITSNLEALKHVGLRPSRKIKLYNGKLESRLVKYELYQGTKKTHKHDQKK